MQIKLNLILLFFLILGLIHTFLTMNLKGINRILETPLKQFERRSKSHLADKAIYRINANVNPLRYGATYLYSGDYIDEQDEYNEQMSNENIYEDLNYCMFSRQKFLEYLNILREKHQVKPMSWNMDLEKEAQIVAKNIKTHRKCKYQIDLNRLFISELYYDAPERITEKELLQKWYQPAYNYNFTHIVLNYDIVKAYPMSVLLWDTVDNVGCAKVCCEDRELHICHFLPKINDPNIFEMKKHIKRNKYIPEEDE